MLLPFKKFFWIDCKNVALNLYGTENKTGSKTAINSMNNGGSGLLDIRLFIHGLKLIWIRATGYMTSYMG